VPRYKGGLYDDTIEPPISRQKTVHKSKPDGSRELSHTIEHDTAVRHLRKARPKGRRGSQDRQMHASPFRTPEQIAAYHRDRTDSQGGDFMDNGPLDTSAIDDRRGSPDPRLERPAPAHKSEQGETFRHLRRAGHAGREYVPQRGKMRYGSRQAERPAPANRDLQNYDIPVDDYSTAGLAPSQPTENRFTWEPRYYNPEDEFDMPEVFDDGTGRIRQINRGQRPYNPDAINALISALSRAR
jgi:hypothetical protein